MNSYTQLHELFVRANNPLKEMTESMSPYMLMEDYTKQVRVNLHIGDGRYCRTGALFTLLTKTINFSIDPNINKEAMNKWIDDYDIHGFDFFDKRFEEIADQDFSVNGYNIVCVHAHVDVRKVIKKFPHWKYLYTTPCCYDTKQRFNVDFLQENNIQCVLAGADNNIMSNKNNVYIYKNMDYRGYFDNMDKDDNVGIGSFTVSMNNITGWDDRGEWC
jgi:hypothetical protein